jgi:hypothetical protein
MLCVYTHWYTLAFIFSSLDAFLQCVSSVIHKSANCRTWRLNEGQDIPNSMHGRHRTGNFVTQKAFCCSVPGPPGKEVKTEIVWSMETLILVSCPLEWKCEHEDKCLTHLEAGVCVCLCFRLYHTKLMAEWKSKLAVGGHLTHNNCSAGVKIMKQHFT